MRKFENVTYNKTGILPTRATSNSAGYDIYSPEEVVCQPKQVTPIVTNIKVKMDSDEVFMMYVRSSIGIKRHLSLANGTGIIDSDFYNSSNTEGNIVVALYNYGDEPQVINAGDRICQGVFMKYLITDDDKPLTDKRIGGIGSTNK